MSLAIPNLLSWFKTSTVSDADVRAEIWRLGSRHLGEPLQGALVELKAPDLPLERIKLLKACVSRLKRR